ncbi:hypothetical protein TMEN_3813 [Trichophyton mentagrophytes]|nr:hypothetical protein H101_01604 [Trichophyton interdigitale H6]KAF3894858.1 Acyl-transf-3 multi-domain protein [Trichophyton interdigitale]KAG5218903.1 Acyl-transf-3 multi-domain protein [Trichophyton interdigitale]KAG8209769.1 Acyl-transf-3 multi-domain protein [Trichophyton interdigitale]GBF61331.1 hypothetical protein TMEN_3813 [Trichophyton mentagrophytes]
MAPKKRDDNWVDGLRGVASFIVVTGHLCTAFVPWLHDPALSDGGPSSIFQLPILRLCVGGRGSVAIFFIITGFVNSINPVKNARADNTYVGLTNLARSTFTRSGRLMVPTAIATVIAWALCQMGAFSMAQRADASWIRATSPAPSATFGEAVTNLIWNLVYFWHTGASVYDGTHWTLKFFLSASFRTYLTLLALTLVKRRYWYAVTGLLWAYAWLVNDHLVGINIFPGMILAQLQVDYGSRATQMLPKVVPSILIFFGLIIWGFPQNNQTWAWWSAAIRSFIVSITPANADHSRYASSLGTCTLMLGIFFSRNARRFLTLPLFNFLGRVSFPVYLLHNILIRTILSWMVYGESATRIPVRNEKGELLQLGRTSSMAFIFILPIFYAVLYLVAHMWATYVEPQCGKAVDWLKDIMFKERPDSQEKLLPLPNGGSAS